MKMKIEQTKLYLAPGTYDAVNDCLAAGDLVTGSHLRKLEELLCDRFNKSHAILTTNCFAAICSVLNATNSGFNDSVWTSSMGTCYAVVNAIKASGNRVDFVDSTLEKLSLDGRHLPKDQHLRIVIPHHFGLVENSKVLSAKHNNFILHDYAQSALSIIDSHRHHENIVISFYPTKWINGIDGGAFLTNDKDLASKVQDLVSYSHQMEYDTITRYNYKLSNLHAAVAYQAMLNIDEIRCQLTETHMSLAKRLKEDGYDIVKFDDNEIPMKMLIRESDRSSAETKISKFQENGIGARRELGMLCQGSEKLKYVRSIENCNRIYSLPLYPNMSKNEIDYVTTVARHV